MKKIIATIILVVIAALTLTGCGNSIVKKSLEQANIAIKSKDYDKALVALELALDEENDNVEANKLYSILESYQKAKKAVEENKIKEAKEILDDIDGRYKNYSIKEDVDSLNNQIEEKTKEVEVTNNNITKLERLIDEKNYSEAKTLIGEINKGLVNEEQQNNINELNSKIDLELAKNEEERIGAEKAKADAEKKAKQKDEYTSKMAIKLAKEYELKTNPYVSADDFGNDGDIGVEFFGFEEHDGEKYAEVHLFSKSMQNDGGYGTLNNIWIAKDGTIYRTSQYEWK